MDILNRYDPKRVQATRKMSLPLKTRFTTQILFLWVLFVFNSGIQQPIFAADRYRKMINCDIHQTACIKRISTCTITFDVTPKPIKAMKDLLFRVSLSGNVPVNVKAPYIDLGMPGMNMGPNRVVLKLSEPGVYEGKGIIVRCPSGRRIWQATVTVPNIGQAEFIFDVIY